MSFQVLCQRTRNRFLAHRRLLHLAVWGNEVAGMPAAFDLLEVVGDDEITPVAREEVKRDLPQLLDALANFELEADEKRIWGQVLHQLDGLGGRHEPDDPLFNLRTGLIRAHRIRLEVQDGHGMDQRDAPLGPLLFEYADESIHGSNRD